MLTPHMAWLANDLSKLGRDVVYVCNQLMAPARLQQGWSVPEAHGLDLKVAPTPSLVRQLVCSASADSIHITEGLRGNGLVRLAQRQIRARGLGEWVIMETVNDGERLGAVKRMLYRHLFHRYRHQLQGLLAIGSKTPSWVTAQGMEPTKVFPFAYFLNLPDTNPPPLEGCPPSKVGVFRFIFVGRLIELKRVDHLFTALESLHFLPIECWIVCGGPLESRLRAQADLALPGRVRWFGRQPIETIPGLIAQADCLILPSRRDGWGAVVSEALLVGTPAICSDACGAAEAVKASGVGGVFPKGDLPRLTQLCEKVAKQGQVDRDTRSRIANWARGLSSEAGARYLDEILTYSCSKAGERRPIPPWRGSSVVP